MDFTKMQTQNLIKDNPQIIKRDPKIFDFTMGVYVSFDAKIYLKKLYEESK